MKDSFGNSFTKTLATTVVATVTLLLFITTAFAGGKLGGFSAYLPLIILATSSLSILSIWMFGRPRKADSLSARKLAALELRVAELEERITNAEIVENFESRLAKKEALGRAATSHTAPVESPLTN